MTTIANHPYLRIEFNGKSSYFVIDSADQCRLVTNTERKAKNAFNKILQYAGY